MKTVQVWDGSGREPAHLTTEWVRIEVGPREPSFEGHIKREDFQAVQRLRSGTLPIVVMYKNGLPTHRFDEVSWAVGTRLKAKRVHKL